jgi:hypothetical protein
MIAGHGETGVVAGRALTDFVSLGVLASRVPRDAVDDAVEATGEGRAAAGRQAAAACGGLPGHGLGAVLLGGLRGGRRAPDRNAAGVGLLGRAVGTADEGSGHPGAAAARPGADGGAVLAGRRSARGPGHGRRVPWPVAADEHRRYRAGRAGHAGEPGRVRPGGGSGAVPEGAAGDRR